MAEYSNFFRQAADQYLRAYIDMANRLDAEWIVVHAGFHFTADYEQRKQASLERLQRASAYAEDKDVHLLLENMNREPEDAEVNYLGYTVEECAFYFENLTSPNLHWTFTINHATLVPEGIDGFLDAFGVDRMREVRVADNLGDKEHHMFPGEGSIDFRALFTRLEGMGYQGQGSGPWTTWSAAAIIWFRKPRRPACRRPFSRKSGRSSDPGRQVEYVAGTRFSATKV